MSPVVQETVTDELVGDATRMLSISALATDGMTNCRLAADRTAKIFGTFMPHPPGNCMEAPARPVCIRLSHTSRRNTRFANITGLRPSLTSCGHLRVTVAPHRATEKQPTMMQAYSTVLSPASSSIRQVPGNRLTLVKPFYHGEATPGHAAVAAQMNAWHSSPYLLASSVHCT